MAPLLGQLEFGLLLVRHFGCCLPALALAEPVFIFLEFAFDLSLFESAPSDLYLIGGEKDIAYKNSEIDYQQIKGIPLFNANLGNVGHNGSLSKPFGGKMAQAARLWLQWQLKGDQKAAKAFVGPHCTLCKDPEWVVKKKNMK